MKRINIIGIDIVLLDEETGDYEFKATIDSEFINSFDIDIDILQEGLRQLMSGYIVDKGE